MTGFSAVSTLKSWERWYETVVTTQNNLKSQVDATFIRRRARFKQVLNSYDDLLMRALSGSQWAPPGPG